MQDRSKDGISVILDFSEQFLKNFREEIKKKNRVITLNSMAQSFGPAADEAILNAIRLEGLVYVGGKLYFEVTPDGAGFYVGMQAFFQNAKGDWMKKENKSASQPLSDLLLDDRNELKREHRIEYELNEPK